jgi:hypothetical protein
MDAEARKKLAERVEQFEQKKRDWISKFPEDLQPLAWKVEDARKVAVKVITRKYRIQMAPNPDPEQLAYAMKRVEEEKVVFLELEQCLVRALRESGLVRSPDLSQKKEEGLE